MAYSRITYVYAGVNLFVVNFPLGYISQDDITVRVNDEVDGLGDPVYRTITWITDGTISISGSLVNGDLVQLERTVEKEQLTHDYADGEIIIEQNIDESFKQAIMLVHEVLDGRFGVFEDNVDMGGNRITNMGDAIDQQDAVTRAQLEDFTGNAPAYAAAAAASAVEASGYADDAQDTLADTVIARDLAEDYRDDALLAKQQAESYVAGLKWRPSCRAATNGVLPTCVYNNGAAGVGATLTASSNGVLAAQDGVTMVNGDRLLVKNEVTSANNGVYTVTSVGSGGSPFILTRATDADTWTELVAQVVSIEEGSAAVDYAYSCIVNQGGTIGTTNVVWNTFKIFVPSATIDPSKFTASAYASQAEAEAGTENTKIMTALRTRQGLKGVFSYLTMSYFVNQLTSGTNQTAYSAGTNTCPFNRTVVNNCPGVTRSGNQFTFANAGTYWVEAAIPVRTSGDRPKLRWYDVTAGTYDDTDLIGFTQFGGNGTGSVDIGSTAMIEGQFVAIAGHVYELRFYTTGAASSLASSQGKETYERLKVYYVA